MTAEMRDKLNQAHSDAWDQKRSADLHLEAALRKYSDAEYRRIQCELALIEDRMDRLQFLQREIVSNRAEWSGGAHSHKNITEAVTRDTAIAYLRRA